MNIKSLILPITTAAAIFAAPANANLLFDLYAGATIGIGGATLGTDLFDSDKQDSYSAQSYGLVAGIDIPLFRLEAEYDFINIDQDAKLHVGMVNGYFKIPGLVVVNPYIGVGVGATFDVDADFMEHDGGAAYQAMLGLTFNVPALPIKIDAEGRALYAPDFATVAGTSTTIDAVQYDIRAKVRYIF